MPNARYAFTTGDTATLPIKHDLAISLKAADTRSAAQACREMADALDRGYIPGGGFNPITGYVYETKQVRKEVARAGK